METITNAAQAAAKAVWGESGDGKEPVSGLAGDESKGEPFDAGNKDSTTQEAGTAEDEQVELKGPGPKPLETVAAEHGGDAGNRSTENATSSNPDMEDGEQGDTKDENNGTGEEYVKSSGLQADGGDFDATNPGAGREADRLMEEKGLNREDGEGKEGSNDNKSSGDQKGGHSKPSLGERIKAKLHKS